MNYELPMTNDQHGRDTAPNQEQGQAGQTGRRRHPRLLLVLIAMVVLLAAFLVPPLISIGQYKSRITQAISQSFGRPVRLASVELRLLPWPGFVLTDLTVAEDPAYGAEPVLHANTVTANIRLLSLWRGKLEISSVSVDEASLNVVRMSPGRWNLDPLFRTAAAEAGPTSRQAHHLPYLQATNSRINFKDGAEKLPFSLVNTDLSLWQENPGEWRLRLRGQPARTDVALDMEDTGEVRLEASLHRAPELRRMPLHVDLDWRQAQLGQLSRLLIGYDPGWRGDLTGELHLQGTPDAANVTTRLRATGVHRAEFAPAAPLDFDAHCGFVYHYSQRALDNLECNSPLGDGRLRLTGNVAGANAAPNLTLELDRISVAAGLDVLRTLRSGINPDLEAGGSISGKLAWKQGATDAGSDGPREQGNKRTRRRVIAAAQGPLTGSLTVEGFELSGGSLAQPLRVPRIVFEPAVLGPVSGREGASQTPQVLAGTIAIPAGGTAPLSVNLRLALVGYQAGIHGQASLARARELAQIAGARGAVVLDGLAGAPLTASLVAEGPWLASEAVLPSGAASLAPAPPRGGQPPVGPQLSEFDRGMKPAADTVAGTVTLHDVNWRADFLANRVQIAAATLHLGQSALRWDAVEFSYGPVKGTASLNWPVNCAQMPAASEPVAAASPSPCTVQFQARFGALDAGAMEAAFLGARQQGTLFSDLIDRFHPASAPLWPAMQGTIQADALAMGPVTLTKASATVKVADDHAEFSGFQASVFGGQVQADGTVHWSTGNQGGPAYALTAQFDQLRPAAVGKLLAARWSGGAIKGGAKIDLSGFTGKELAASAKGTLHFDWRNGSVAQAGAAAQAEPVAPALARFNDWTGDAEIGDGALTLGQNQLVGGGRKLAVKGTVTFGKPPKVQLGKNGTPLVAAAGHRNSEP